MRQSIVIMIFVCIIAGICWIENSVSFAIDNTIINNSIPSVNDVIDANKNEPKTNHKEIQLIEQHAYLIVIILFAIAIIEFIILRFLYIMNKLHKLSERQVGTVLFINFLCIGSVIPFCFEEIFTIKTFLSSIALFFVLLPPLIYLILLLKKLLIIVGALKDDLKIEESPESHGEKTIKKFFGVKNTKIEKPNEVDLSERDKNFSGHTLFMASKAMTKLLDNIHDSNSKDKKIPEFRLILSGDTEIVSHFPETPPYDLLHFMQIQILWAKEYNNKLLKDIWRSGPRSAAQREIISAELEVNPNKLCSLDCGDTLHTKLLNKFDKWKNEQDLRYYAANDRDEEGKLVDTLVNETVKQWCKSKKIPIETFPRAIRLLFSTENELIAAAKYIKKENMPSFRYDEIINIWISYDEISNFNNLELWADNILESEMVKKYYPFPERLSKLNKTPKNIIFDYARKYHIEIRDLWKECLDLVKTPINGTNVWMFILISNIMRKLGYSSADDSPPEEANNDQKIIGFSRSHLAYLLICLMAMYYKNAIPLMPFFNKVLESSYALYNSHPEKYIKDILYEFQN